MTIQIAEKSNSTQFTYVGEIPFIFDDILPKAGTVIRARYFRKPDGSLLIDLADENSWAEDCIQELTENMISAGKFDNAIERYRDE